MNTTFMQTTQYFAEATRLIRKALAAANQPSFSFRCKASGRVDGSPKMEFILSGEYGENEVKGRSIEEVLTEFLRRRGWNQRWEPLELEDLRELEKHGTFEAEI